MSKTLGRDDPQVERTPTEEPSIPSAESRGLIRILGHNLRSGTDKLTVRSRVIVALIAFTALGMALSSTLTHWVQHTEVDRNIDKDLTRIVKEFQTQVASGVNVHTEEPFESTSDVLFAAMQWILPSENGDAIAIVGDQPVWAAPYESGLQLSTDPKFVRTVVSLKPADGIVLRSTNLHVGTAKETSIRYVAIPTSLKGDQVSGWYVAAIDRNLELRVVNNGFVLDIGVSVLALALIAIFSAVFVSRLLAPIRLAKENASRISHSDLTGRVPVVGRDDLAELTETINEMLDRLESAFTAQRNFFDDVGHELRTPVTIIRGHLELVDINDPGDVSASRDIALDELERMQLLIDDLLTLAAVERPNFISLIPTDIYQLTDTVAEKAASLGERDWQIESYAKVLVPADEHRITRAWLQIAENAVKYSEPHSTITIGSAVRSETSDSPAAVDLWVSDQGVGIPAADLDRVFERFSRAETGRGEEGSGLGLAIVKAIVKAHGGEVEVESVLGVGTKFTIKIPLQSSAPGSMWVNDDQQEGT